jgi:8-oxo-dGTP diphosphatase
VNPNAFAHDCVGALLVRGGEVLLGRRSADRAWLPGAWDVFGGHIEAGETPEDALRREVLEELGVHAIGMRELGLLEARDRGWRLRLFAVEAWAGEPVNRQPEEHARLRWMQRQAACACLAPAHPGFAAMIDAALSGVPKPSKGAAPARC